MKAAKCIIFGAAALFSLAAAGQAAATPAWTPRQVWTALESKPLITVGSYQQGSVTFHVIGPATQVGDAFQPTKVAALTPVGTAVKVAGRSAWHRFSVAARVIVSGYRQEQPAFFCLQPTSSGFRLTGVSFDFAVGYKPCR